MKLSFMFYVGNWYGFYEHGEPTYPFQLTTWAEAKRVILDALTHV